MTRPAPLRPNPQWADEALAGAWRALERNVSPDLLPTPGEVRDSRVSFEDLGSGGWGTVMRTREHGTLLKLTTDPDEARFAAWSAGLDDWPAGCVRYLRALDLGPGAHPSRPGATVWALWREEAFSVGEVIPTDDINALPEAQARLLTALLAWRRVASFVRAAAVSPGADLPAILANAQVLLGRPAVSIGNAPLGYPVGAALSWMLDRGVLLPDTHAGNVGLVRRGGGLAAALTDASGALFLCDRPPPMPGRV